MSPLGDEASAATFLFRKSVLYFFQGTILYFVGNQPKCLPIELSLVKNRCFLFGWKISAFFQVQIWQLQQSLDRHSSGTNNTFKSGGV